MKLIFKAVAILVQIFSIIVVAKYNLGVVTVSLTKLRIETSLNFFIIINLIVFILFYSILRIYNIFGLTPQVIKDFFFKRSEKYSENNFNQANIDFILGNYKKSYVLSIKAAKRYNCIQKQILAYLLAFKAAVKLDEIDKQNEIITILNKISNLKWELAISLVIAQSFCEQNKFNEAINYLNKAQKIDGSNLAVIQLSNKIRANNNLIIINK